MGYSRKKRRNNKDEHQKYVIIRCKFHSKPVFDIDTCSDIKLKREADVSGQCKDCQYSY